MAKDINFKEFSSRGGKATLAKYGPDHFSEMGRKGAMAKLEADPDYFKKLSALGVAARQAKKNSA